MPNRKSEQHTATRIIRLLRSSAEGLDVRQIAERLGHHPTGVRRQLQRMEARNLVTGDPAPSTGGRPPVIWTVTARAIAEADFPHSGWAMARSLARAIPASKERLREVEEAGVEMGRELVEEIESVSGDGDDRVLSALTALGFAPERDGEGAVARYCLKVCPYAEAVRENPQVVCTLHKGVVRGVVDRVRPGAELTAFEARPPEIAGCLIEVTEPGDGSPTG